MEKVKIAIVEDNSEFAQNCANTLSVMEEVDQVEVFSSTEDLSQNHQNKFDLVFMDIVLPGKSGIDYIKERSDLDNDPKYIMLSTLDTDEALMQAMKAGAVGFVLKKDLKDIKEVARMVMKEGGILSPGAAAKVISFFRKPPTKETHSLTPREKEILNHIINGYRTKDIARNFGTKEGTVRIQIKSIFKKLQVNSRVDLVRKYSRF
ncbi:response regulator [Leptospira johnsonii]|uniref:Response regulator receiver domain / transcriptional regulator, LuxR family multi-domain protein n=1 Tax=Leptospira johnsonii TaxID=1917820 RepID=A0A2P2D3G5_9LEPT|nr:response regulator transcription factor [Leptospira johnsonii]GBF39172.1 response regulator receiver domain / transcriptional regulator, LuxR family multi-domain protein [Leptospira johnsonii]